MEANSIMTFSNPQFGEVRTMLDENGEPWFCLSDVCKTLGLMTSKVVQRLGDDVLSKYPISDNLGRMQMANFVNEDGLYDAILDSRKPEARKFRKWVTSEVLPQIRKTGGYLPLTPPTFCRRTKVEGGTVSDEEILSRALLIAQKTIEMKNNLLREQRPKVLFAEAVTASEDSILIRDLAKLITQNGYPIGQARLFYWLRLHGYLFQHETRPIQEWVEKGLFEVNVQVLSGNRKHIRLTTRVTGKGQQYFLDGFLSGRFKASNNDWC